MTPTEADWVDRLAAAKAEVERLRAELNDEIRKTINTKLILNQREAELAAARDGIRLCQVTGECLLRQTFYEVSDRDVDGWIAAAKERRKELERCGACGGTGCDDAGNPGCHSCKGQKWVKVPERSLEDKHV